jgi:hypothetical protein
VVSSWVWGSWPDIYYCLTVTVLFFLGGTLSHERTGLYFVCAAGLCQRRLSRVQVPQDSWPYFTASDLRHTFGHLLWLAGSRWRYSTPPPHGEPENWLWPLLVTSWHGPHRNILFPAVTIVVSVYSLQRECVCWVISQRWPLFTESSLGNGSMCHIVPSLRLFVPNCLQVYHHFFSCKVCACDVWSVSPFSPWLGFHGVYSPTAP